MALQDDSDEAVDNPFGNNDPVDADQVELDLDQDDDSSNVSGEKLGGLLATLAKNNTL